MKLSEKWLREWVNPDVATNELVDKLTLAGLEVDAIEPVAGVFTGVVVGQVVAVESHPNADKLRCCQVDVATGEYLSIVCGATNVRQGLKVPVAIVGAVLPGNFKIKKAKLRGVASYGMLCSAKELGLADNAEGLLELPADAPVGQDLRTYLDLDDVSIDIDLTPNRSDCLSVAGIAREVGVLTGCDVTQWPEETVASQTDRIVNIHVEAEADCPRYIGRVIENINSQATTPVWMQEKLRRSGLRSLGPVVDVTNYVMLELGQPMHAFDLAQLNGCVTVRRAAHNETITLLDGQQVTVIPDTLLIADEEKPLALAGIMGGEAGRVGEHTTDILLEAAYFSPLTIAGKARAYGLHTDSSHRFERGVDPELPQRAMERATCLLLSIVGGQAGPIVEKVSPVHLPQREEIILRAERIQRVLGVALTPQQVETHLTRLGLNIVQQDGASWTVRVPSFRFDLAIEEDLIEELGRLYGYDVLPETRPQISLLTTTISEHVLPVERVQTLLVDRGYQEAITYSFVDPDIQQYLAQENEQVIALANPISADLSVMRTSLWPGLIQALVYNLNRQHERVRLFEIGRSFKKDGEGIEQHRQISGVVCGSRYPQQWGAAPQPVDFFDVKADVEALLRLSGNETLRFEAQPHPALHPGQSARIYKADKPIGWLGALHPKLNKPLGLNERVYLFELALAPVLQANIPTFSPLSRYPMNRRDLALVVENEISVGQIEDCLKGIKSDILKSIQVFDVYTGDAVGQGKKSIALAFYLQHNDRTLTDEEVDTLMNQIAMQLTQQVGAVIRT